MMKKTNPRNESDAGNVIRSGEESARRKRPLSMRKISI